VLDNIILQSFYLKSQITLTV